MSATTRSVLSVSELNRNARITIEERFQQVWVLGEMSNFARPRSGHWYFTLKDDNAQVRCAMFANRNRAVRAQPTDGQQFIIRGRVSLYEGRGEFQIIVDHLEVAGEGALRQEFDALKVKLADEGLFDHGNKRPLPPFPKHIVVISSATGAAIHDVLAVWHRRYPIMQVTLIPVAVQGAEAEAQIVEALQRAQALDPDAVLLTRGGGSLEDLWAFNSEQIARRIADCQVPVVSAVGHEIDVTIADFVADVRAPTPSAAAEMLTPEVDDMIEAFADYEAHLLHDVQNQLSERHRALAALRRVLRNPDRILEQASLRIDELGLRSQRALHTTTRERQAQVEALARQLRALGPAAKLDATTTRLYTLGHRLQQNWLAAHQVRDKQLGHLARMLESVSPLPTLARGYAVVRNEDDTVISSVENATPGATLTTHLRDGTFTSTVNETQPGASLGRAVDDNSA